MIFKIVVFSRLGIPKDEDWQFTVEDNFQIDDLEVGKLILDKWKKDHENSIDIDRHYELNIESIIV